VTAVVDSPTRRCDKDIGRHAFDTADTAALVFAHCALDLRCFRRAALVGM